MKIKQHLSGWAGVIALSAISVVQAQNVTLFGSLGNFDVLNDTGQDAHGFEIELQGVPAGTPMPYTFDWTRYGAAKKTQTATGILLRWASPYDAASQRFTVTTVVPATFTPTFGHSCVGTAIVGCDHYGTSLAYNAKVAYYWLVADPANPGQLMRAPSGQVQILQPTVQILPPAQPGLAPQVAFEIVAPVPPPPPIPKPVPQHGEAKWVKVYKTELQREVALEELVADNPIVPQDAGAVETGWKLLQFNPTSNGNSGVLRNQGGVNGGSRSILRRYEYYKFTGAYDPIDHGAICADGTCSAPAANEIGDFIGAQNAAANIGVPSITVTVAGDGQVSDATSTIRCPGTCSMATANGTVVTLTAKNGKGIFSGWTGACVGTNPICTVTVDEAKTTTATFLTPYKLTLRTSGVGTLTADPVAASYLSGSVVTLTATPGAGQTFAGWVGGGCAGTALTCTVTMTADTLVTANFTGVVAPPPPASYKLVLKVNGNGKLTSNPAASTFAAGSAVTLTATPGAGVPFVGWTGGGCTGTALTCTITMTADTTVTANFR